VTHDLVAALLGLLAGVLSALFGVGGGIVFVPTLIFLGNSARVAVATSLAAMGRPRKISPTRAKRSGESVARNLVRAPLVGAPRVGAPCAPLSATPMPWAARASATAAAVVAAESTMATPVPMTPRIAAASTGKWVQPSTSVSGADAPRNSGPR